MCGICGSVGINVNQSSIQKMTQAMFHRGPDSTGLICEERVQIGIRRLRIIDLERGDQPIYNEDKSIAVTFNGEIYNYKDLYQLLSEKGHKFYTRSDTEVIVHAYEEWGKDSPSYMRGMFAFAVLDKRKIDNAGYKIFLARDSLGIKPLYYWQAKDLFIYASEVRALLTCDLIPRTLSPAGLYTYILFGSVQEPLTIIDGIRSLPPASWLTIEDTPAGVIIDKGQFWKPPQQELLDPTSEQVRYWVTETVQSHLISDVPYGAFLSGGIDSGAIVSLSSQSITEPLNTFTLAFDNWPSDERDLALITASRWKTNHKTHVVSQHDVLRDLPSALASMDQPTIDGVNSWYVSREAKRAGLTVALSGVGGDELFAGYPTFRKVPPLYHLPHHFPWLHFIPGWSDGWPIFPGNRDARRKIMAYLSGDVPLAHPYFSVRGLFTGLQTEYILAPRIIEQLCDNKPLEDWQIAVQTNVRQSEYYDNVSAISWLELTQYMLSTLLRDTDMMSMAHSLEVRVPFVDQKLVERVISVSGKRKITRGRSKPLLTNALGELLPTQITKTKKRTFTLPFENWLRQELATQVSNTLYYKSFDFHKWLNPLVTRKIWNSFIRGQTNWSRPWALYVLIHWIEKNI